MTWFRKLGRLIRRGINLSLSDLDHFMDLAAFGAPTSSGATISKHNALGLPAVWACVGLISDSGAMLPGKVFHRINDGSRDREPQPNHPLYPLVHDQVNPFMPASEWRRLTLAHLLTWGNSYSWIEWDQRPIPRHLWIIPPDQVRVVRESMTAPIRYFVRDKNAGEEIEFRTEDMLHIRGLGFDGTMGYSPVGMLREAFGLVKADQESAGALHSSGMTSRLVLEYPEAMDEGQAEEFRKSWDAAYGGTSGKFKAIVLQNGMKATPISINPQDAQFLERSQYDDAKIYQIYRVPPHMVGDTTKATSWGTGIEQQTIGFCTFTLMPWMDLIETWLAMKLLSSKQQRSHFIEYDLKGLLRGDTRARSAFYKVMIDIGAYSPNRVLKAENEPPYDGGDVYRRPLNTAFVDSNGQPVSVTGNAEAPSDEARTIQRVNGGAVGNGILDTMERRLREAKHA